MIPAEKYCPECNHRFWVDPSNREGICKKCETPYTVNPALSDTDRTRGGFTIKPLFKENDAINRVLSYVYGHPGTYAIDISCRLKIPISSVRGYIRKLSSENLIVVVRKKGTLYVSCTENYIPQEKEEESKKVGVCVECGKSKLISNMKKGKCLGCIEKQKEIYKRFKELNYEAERNINAMQRNKNAVTV